MRFLTQIGLVSAGSIVGGLARWGISALSARLFGTAFPWGTLFINLSGCLFIGWFMTFLGERMAAEEGVWLRHDDLRLLVGIAFTGAYTTFSTFAFESHALHRADNNLAATTYVLVSVVLGLLAVKLGVFLALPK